MNRFKIAVFGESRSGKSLFIKNLPQRPLNRGNLIDEEEEEHNMSHQLPKFSIESIEMELFYTINHHYDSRLWMINQNPPERKLESSLANWIYENNFIHDSPRMRSVLSKSPFRPSSSRTRARRSSIREGATDPQNPPINLLVKEDEIRHDIVKKYLSQQYHVHQSKIFLTLHDYSGKELYRYFHSFFYLYDFYDINCIVFDMDRLLSLTTRQECLAQLRYWIQQILLKQPRLTTPIGSSSADDGNNLNEGVAPNTAAMPFYIALVGTHKDIVNKITDHIKISNLLYEKLQDLNVWNHIITNPYLEYDTTASPSDSYPSTRKGRFSPSQEGENANGGKTTASQNGLDLWFFPTDNINLRSDDPSLVTLRNEIEDHLMALSNQRQAKIYHRRSSMISLNLPVSGNNVISSSLTNTPKIYMSLLRYLKIVDNLNMETNPFLSRETFVHLLQGSCLNSLNITDLTTYSHVVSLLLHLLHQNGVILWLNHSEMKDLIIIKPLEYLLKPLNYLIYEHISINTEITEDLFPSHEFSKSRFPNEWQQMIKYGIITHQLLQSLLLPYEFYTSQLLFVFVKLRIVIPIATRSLISASFSDGDSDCDDDESEKRFERSQGFDRDYHYLLPALFPLISENKLFSGNYQPFNSSLSLYFYFQVNENQQGYLNSIPGRSTGEFLNEFNTWNDLRWKGSLPHGLFELLLVKLINYSQQTSQDLHFKFSENASKLSTQIGRRTSVHQSRTDSVEHQDAENFQTAIIHAYHHCFYKNQMILQFGNWRFRITNHLEYHLIQIELESLTAFQPIYQKISSCIEELLAIFYPYSSLKMYTLLLSSPSPPLSLSNNAASVASKIFAGVELENRKSMNGSDQISLANVFHKVNDAMIPNYKKKEVFLFDYHLLLALSSLSSPFESSHSYSFQQLTSNLDDSREQYLALFLNSPTPSPTRKSQSIRNSMSLAFHQHLLITGNQLLAKYEPLLEQIKQQRKNDLCSKYDLYFSYIKNDFGFSSQFKGTNTTDIGIGLVEGVTHRLTLYSIRDPLETNQKSKSKEIKRCVTVSSSAVQAQTKADDALSINEHTTGQSQIQQTFKRIQSSSIFIPVIPYSLIQIFQLISSESLISMDLQHLFGGPKLSDQEDIRGLTATQEEISVIESILLEWIIAKYLYEYRRNLSSIERINSKDKVELRQIMPIFIGPIEESHSFAHEPQSNQKNSGITPRPSMLSVSAALSSASQQFLFFDIAYHHLSSISDQLIPQKLLDQLQILLKQLQLPQINKEKCVSYSISGLLSFFLGTIKKKYQLHSSDYFQPYDYYIGFTIKIVETILIQLREIQILREEEEEVAQLLLSNDEEAKNKKKTNKIDDLQINDDFEDIGNDSSSRYLYETPVKGNRRSSQSTRHQSEQYYYQQFLSPKKSPLRFFPQKLVSLPTSSISSSPRVPSSSISPITKQLSKSILSFEDQAFLLQLQKYFQEIVLIKQNHNYMMNYFFFQQRKKNQVLFAMDEQSSSENSSLMKEYFQEISSPTTSKSANYIILFDSIQDYYQRITEIYFEMLHQYELSLEIMIITYKSVIENNPKSVSLDDSKSVPNILSPSRSRLPRGYNVEEITSVDTLYRIYLEYLEKKKYLQTIIKEVLMAYPSN